MAYEDLLKDTSQASTSDSNKFIVTVTDLNVSSVYPIQFRWKYSDGTFGDWSASRSLIVPGESFPGAPTFASTDVVGGAGFINVTWNGLSGSSALTNIDRVDVYIDGLPFDGTKPAASFKTAGTQTIAASSGTYMVGLYAVSVGGTRSAISSVYTVTVTGVDQPVLAPEKPTAPTATAGLSSIIVEWDGKKDGGSDFTTGSFAGAKVFIGTTSNFTPSDNNWVHTLNFANGSNKVAIGVGSTIDKDLGTKLAYATAYYIKIDTINANGVSNGDPVAAVGSPVTISKSSGGVGLPASEITTGTIIADNSITAGVTGGQRVVISGSSSPFTIYGSDGTTELLKFTTGGTYGSLEIKGSGTFSGSLSAATGSFSGSLNIGTESGGLYPFSVSSSGVLRAISGTIGGWQIGSTYLKTSDDNFQISNSGVLYVGPSGGNHIRISSTGGIATYNSGTQVPGFSLSTTGNIIIGDASGTKAFSYDSSTGILTLQNSKFVIQGASAATGGDNNNYAGESTLSLNQNGELTRARAFHYGGTTVPTSSNTSRDIYNTTTGGYDTVDFNAGDIWMTVD